MQQIAPGDSDRLATDMQQSCLGLRIGRLNRIVGGRYEQALRPLGLSIAQTEVLSTLVLVRDAVRPIDLATWLAVERSTMSRNLASLEKRGYVATTETSPTGRSQRVVLTAAGRAALLRADEAWRTTQRAVAADLGEDAVATLDGWLTSLTGRSAPGGS